jgi:hypothetical protein
MQKIIKHREKYATIYYQFMTNTGDVQWTTMQQLTPYIIVWSVSKDIDNPVIWKSLYVTKGIATILLDKGKGTPEFNVDVIGYFKENKQLTEYFRARKSFDYPLIMKPKNNQTLALANWLCQEDEHTVTTNYTTEKSSVPLENIKLLLFQRKDGQLILNDHIQITKQVSQWQSRR